MSIQAAVNDGGYSANLSADTACLAACDCLASSFSTLIRGLPTRDFEGRKVLVRVGDVAGVHFAVSDGHLQATSSRAGDEAFSKAFDCTVRFDGVQTLLRAVESEGSLPGLMLRRKVRFEGDVLWLQNLRNSAPAGASSLISSSAAVEMRNALSTQIRAAVTESQVAASGAGSCTSFGALWIPDEASNVCMSCTANFTWMRRRHHCRGCGRLLCASCAPYVRQHLSQTCIPRPGTVSRSQRLCFPCAGNGASVTGQLSSRGISTMHAEVAESAPSVPENSGATCADLRVELDLLRKERAERAEAALLEAVAQIRVVTQLVALSIGASLLVLIGYYSFLTYVIFGGALYLGKESSLRRYITIFWAAVVVWAKLRHTKLKVAGLDDATVTAAWLSTHKVVARFLFNTMSSLGGSWNKIGQALSVNVMLPEPYIEEFGKFQDQLPPSSMDEVRATLREEFDHGIVSRLVIDPNDPPLGVASIGQVHRAKWTPPGTSKQVEVVIKVQHRGIDRQFKQDMHSAMILSRVMARIDTENVPDFRPMAKKMQETTMKELDFRLEAANQARAWQAVQENNLDVLVPKITSELVSRRVVAMDYVDGVSFRNLHKELPEVDRESLVASLADHFAVQLVVDGLFHADPHPGNLLVERSTGRLCVLDWGMCCTVSPVAAQTYAALFQAVAARNPWAVSDAMHALGVGKFGNDDEETKPFRLMSFFRVALRDTLPLSLARDGMRELHQKGAEMRRSGKMGKPQIKLDGDLLYVMRAIELVSNSAVQLGVTHSVLKTINRRSHATLLGRRECPAHIHRNPHDVLPPFQMNPQTARNSLEHELIAVLREFYVNGHILGVQLSVQDASGAQRVDGSLNLVDIAGGVCSHTNPQPVTADTIFNWLDIAKLPVALTLLRLVDSGQLSLLDKVTNIWPGFCGGHDVTIEHVLGHTAGLFRPLPPGITTLPELLDVETSLKAFEGATSLEAPGRFQRYHYAAFGYLCAGIYRHATGKELPTLWDDMLQSSCLNPSDLTMCLPASTGERRPVAHVAASASSAGLEEMSGLMLRMQQLMDSNGPAERGVLGAAQEVLDREHLVDLSLFAEHSLSNDVAAACLPGMQAFGTALTAASLLRSVVTGRVLSAELLAEACRSRRPGRESSEAGEAGNEEFCAQLGHVLQIDDMTDFGLGLQLVDEKTSGVDVCVGGDAAWGHVSQTGSAALFLPGPRPLTVGLMLNLRGCTEDESSSHPVRRAVLTTISKLRPIASC